MLVRCICFVRFTIILVMVTSFVGIEARAEKRIKILGWNVEARDNNPGTIEQHLRDLDGFDIIGLSEVDKDNFNRYRKAASHGEGVGGDEPSFRYIPGNTGGDILRLAIIYDTARFDVENKFELADIQEDHRAPLVAHFKLKGTDVEFLFMVNHLARGNSEARNTQATKLQQWAKDQELPIIAVGDFNFDYSVDDLKGNKAFNLMLKDDAFKWVRPPELFKTQLHPEYNGVLDFVFTANTPPTWRIKSRILTHGFPNRDNENDSDHRPVQARLFVP